MAVERLCPPAAIFLVFMVVQIGIDITKGFLNSAMIKAWVGIIFTILLNYLCNRGLGIVSWIIIFIPFLLMTVIISVLLFVFGLNPSSGKIRLEPEERDGKKILEKKYELKGLDSRGKQIPETTIKVESKIPF